MGQAGLEQSVLDKLWIQRWQRAFFQGSGGVVPPPHGASPRSLLASCSLQTLNAAKLFCSQVLSGHRGLSPLFPLPPWHRPAARQEAYHVPLFVGKAVALCRHDRRLFLVSCPPLLVSCPPGASPPNRSAACLVVAARRAQGSPSCGALGSSGRPRRRSTLIVATRSHVMCVASHPKKTKVSPWPCRRTQRYRLEQAITQWPCHSYNGIVSNAVLRMAGL